MIIYSFNKKEEERIYQRWILEGRSKQISFENYKDELSGNKKETKENDKKERKVTYKDKARFNRLDVT